MNRIFNLLIAVSLFGLASCGQICFLGSIGKCDVPPNPDPPTDNLQLTPRIAGVYRTTLRIGEQMTLTIVGGKAPYFPRPTDPIACADVNNANYVVTPLYPGQCTIHIVDSSNPGITGMQLITILPR